MQTEVEERQFEGAVAILDILGFKNRMLHLTIEQVRDEVIGYLIGLAQWGEERSSHDLRNTPSSQLEFLYFTDTLALLLERKDGTIHSDAEVVMESMVFVCQLVAAGSIILGVPVRGAIAYGEGLVCGDPLFYIGEPFIDAHSLEQRQDWAGIALCRSAARLVEQDDRRTAEWGVPTKLVESGSVVRRAERLRVIDWPPVVRATLRTTQGQPDWDLCFPGWGLNVDVCAKRANTKSFFDRSTCVWPEALPDQLREWCKEWHKRYRTH